MTTPTTSSSDRDKKVLIADDDAAIVDAVAFLLEDEGYLVVKVTGGDIVQAIQRERPAVVLLDIWLSGLDGREICRALKRQEATRQTPVIVVSANRDCATIAGEAGADDFLCKPFEMDDLLAKVARYTAAG